MGAKLIREKTSAYGPDNWSSADVAPDNVSSQAMCKSLNGKVHWAGSWYVSLLVSMCIRADSTRSLMNIQD